MRPELSFQGKVGVVAAAVVLLTIIGCILWLAAEVLFLLFGAILLAILLRAISEGIARLTRLPSGISLLLTIILLFGAVAGLVALLAPQVSSQVSELGERLPESLDRLESSIGTTPIGAFMMEQTPSLEEIGSRGLGFSRVAGFFTTTVGVIANLVLLIVIAVYGAARPDLYRIGVQRLFPIRFRERVGEVIDEVAIALRWWMFGQIAAMVLVGVLTALGLWLLGIPLALTLGLITAVLAFIPNLGPVVSVVPPALLGLMDGPATMAYVVLLYVGIQLVESNLISPQIHRRTVHLPPALMISAQLLAGLLFGLPGLIYATPLTAAILVIVRMVYVEDVLGDDVTVPSENHS